MADLGRGFRLVKRDDAGADTPVGDALRRCLVNTPLPPKRPAHILLMLSGGLDSVALLANLLASTHHEVHAHHIVLDNLERRADAETHALGSILEECETRFRSFEHSVSGHSFMLPTSGGWDTTVTMFTAARVTRALGPWGVDVVVTGHIRPPFTELAEGEAVFHSASLARRRRPPWVRPLAWMPGARVARKADIYESLPAELADAVWYCRRPVPAEDAAQQPCKECHACRTMAEAHALRERREHERVTADGDDGSVNERLG